MRNYFPKEKEIEDACVNVLKKQKLLVNFLSLFWPSSYLFDRSFWMGAMTTSAPHVCAPALPLLFIKVSLQHTFSKLLH